MKKRTARRSKRATRKPDPIKDLAQITLLLLVALALPHLGSVEQALSHF